MAIISKLQENIFNNSSDNLIFIATICSIICGVLVIISKNPIVSVLFLIGLFLTIATYLMSLGLSFIGLSYLLVYVGAVSILFLFILMLINVRVSELVTDNYNSVPLSIITIITFSAIFNDKTPSSYSFDLSYIDMFYINSILDKPRFSTSHNWDSVLSQISHITSIGNVLYTSYPILLLVTSIILLLAMVGAIVITIRH